MWRKIVPILFLAGVVVGSVGVYRAVADPGDPGGSEFYEGPDGELLPAATPGSPGEPDTSRVLSPSQSESASSLALSDDRIQHSVDGAATSASVVEAWYLNDELRGAVVTLVLDRPTDIKAELPAVNFGSTGENDQADPDLPYPYYIEEERVLEVAEVSRLLVFVDLTRDRVVGVIPAPR